MPQLIKDGPEIPPEMLQALDEEKLVFFCGSGISKPTGLPLFDELAEHVWQSVQPTNPKTPAELVALENHQYDRFLGLLEQRLIPGTTRKKAIERLLEPYDGPDSYHKALLNLAALKTGGTRLVTTNFDHRFIEAGCDKRWIDSAPKLPIPKAISWKSLVCIHGLIDKEHDPEGQRLVLTTADFGRAYLTEGWASRFLTDLFREFTVVFIGYSIDDPIVSYLMSALAGERAQTQQYKEAYAFASFDGCDASDYNNRNALWISKGVIPVLYDHKNNHQLLVDTLSEWAKLRQGGRTYRAEIISKCLTVPPRGMHDFLSEQACWALNENEPITAKAFATAPEKAPLEWWLEVFDQAEIKIPDTNYKSKLSQLPTMVVFPSKPNIDTHNGLVAKTNSFNQDLHPVTRWLAHWLCNHLEDPRLLNWVLSKGDRIHPQWRTMIRQELQFRPLKTDGLQKAWQVLSGESIYQHNWAPWWSIQDISLRAEDNSLSTHGKLELLAQLTPILTLKPAIRWGTAPNDSPKDIKDFMECNLFLSCGENYELIENLLECDENLPEILREYFDDLNTLLRLAMDLLNLAGKANSSEDPTYLELQSIADNNKNEHANEWTKLIILVRDSFNQIAKADHTHADIILATWTATRYPIFQRLALHAITEHHKLKTKHACDILLNNDSLFLWSIMTRRECLRFLRKAGNRLKPNQLKAIEKAILNGPPDSQFRKDLNKHELEQAKNENIWQRLKKLEVSGARLSEAARKILTTENRYSVGENNEDELLFVSGDMKWISEYEACDTKKLDKITPAEFIESVAKQSDHNFKDIEYLASNRPGVIRKILTLQTPIERWNEKQWICIIRGLIKTRYIKRRRNVWLLFRDILTNMPNTTLSAATSELSSWLLEIVHHLKKQDIEHFIALWKRIWESIKDKPIPIFSEPLTDALNHPAGKLTESLLFAVRIGISEVATKNAGFGSQFTEMFKALTDSRDTLETCSKTILSADLSFLYWLDHQWTQKNIIDSMDWNNKELASAIWCGYLWQFRVFPDMLVAMKPSLWGLFENWDYFVQMTNSQIQDRVFTFLSVALVEGRSSFDSTDLQELSTKLGAKNLGKLAYALARRLETDKAPETMWSESIKPLLTELWPSDKSLQSSDSSIGLATLAIHTKESFPEAIDFTLNFIQKSKNIGPLLHKLKSTNLAAKHPQELSSLLAALIPADANHWEYHDLPLIMESITKAWENCRANANYIFLADLADTKAPQAPKTE
jgi:hypothetical protein